MLSAMHDADKGLDGKGILYIVSTPIGNLGDITYRAVKTLQEVSLVAAEDTRRTKILLNHYQIDTKLSSYNSFNKLKKGDQFIALLLEGQSVALVSDAGTPGVSDPMYHLVQSAVAEGIDVFSIPGPSAVLAALTVSGLPVDRFQFEGFLPRKKGRVKRLEELAQERRTMVIFESPHRIAKTLSNLLEHFGNRKIALTRELTKLHEEVIRGNLQDLVSSLAEKRWKGEITLVVEGCNTKGKES